MHILVVLADLPPILGATHVCVPGTLAAGLFVAVSG